VNSSQRALAIALVVGAGLAAGFLSYRLQSSRPLLPSAGPPRAGVSADADADAPGADAPGADAPGAVAPEAPPLRPVPTTMPDLELPDLAGKARSLRSFGGRPLIINFWATWCAPCRREIPLLRELRQRYRADQLEIVGIAVDISAAVQEYLRYTPIDYPLLVGEQQGLAAAEQFGMEPVLPFSVFADTQGRIVAVKVGELHRDEADFILTEIREVDKGQIGLAQAREQIEAQLRELAVQRAKAQQNGG
jgi:thiol-disulfide isomerase/thioredoxin